MMMMSTNTRKTSCGLQVVVVRLCLLLVAARSVSAFLSHLPRHALLGPLSVGDHSSASRRAAQRRQGQMTRMSRLHLSSSSSKNSGFLGMDDEDEDDEDEDEEDEDDEYSMAGELAKSPFTGMTLDPDDPNPLIKPRPSRYFRKVDTSIVREGDKDLRQVMTPEERKENLTVMRKLKKSDLPDLRRRQDYAGWVEANNDLKRRTAKDPWFEVNERLRDACQLGASESDIQYLKDLAAKLGGPPIGVQVESALDRPYAVHTEIYDIGLTASQANAYLEFEIRKERAARGRAMMAEQRKNLEKQQKQYEQDLRFPGVRAEREAKERRERTMRRIMDEIEQDNKKKRERAKEILGRVPDLPTSKVKSVEKAIKEAREDVKKLRRKQLNKPQDNVRWDDVNDYDDEEDDDDDDLLASGDDDEDDGIDDDDEDGEGRQRRRRRRTKSSADRAREAAAAEASGGRPRLPGDPDVTRGELTTPVQSSSSTVTGPLRVEVTSTYNKDQSDPPMRKHTFQYTIRITNNSPTDTIQLLGRRFEIQTVGSSMKDVVQGEGVTGRTPVLKPYEVFEYTSTAPLSVRPIATTEIAARMRGEYRYVVLPPGVTTASPEQLQAAGDNLTAELGVFHFIFPEEQRVKPFRSKETDDEEDEEEEEDNEEENDDVKSSKTTRTAPATSSSATSASNPSVPSSSSSLPGDKDILTGDISVPLNDSSEQVTQSVRVKVSSSYRPERSNADLDKHCFAYNIRITNESTKPIQLVSRRFEIQTVGNADKDVVQGQGVTGRQPVLQPGESFEYTSTAPLSVKPLDKTPVLARMQGEYNFIVLNDDGTAPASAPQQAAKLALFHFILPALV